MQSFRSGRRRNGLIPGGGAIAAIVLVILILVLVALRAFLPDAFTALAMPLWSFGQAAANAEGNFASLFGNAGDLARQRDVLLSENQAINEENRALRGQVADLTKLELGTTTPTGRILAGVLARPPVSPYDTLVVAAGKADGVRAGAFAYGPGNVPLGTVARVADHSATVELFSLGGLQTTAWAGEKRIPLTLVGKGGGAFTATVPSATAIQPNDIVYVPGPGALPVGTVVKVESNPSSPTDTLDIAPYTNLFSLTWLLIGP